MRALYSLGAMTAALAVTGGAQAQSVGAVIAGGKPILEVRGRVETVDQAGFANTAEAYTLRTRLGWETAAVAGIKALVEIEDVRAAGDYNVAVPGPGGTSLNGKTAYPIVNDPEVTELNRLQLAWTASPAATVTLGRQRILIDDQRFVGNLGWRQDEQTFDALRLELGSGPVKGTYAYVGKVNRSLGEERDWDSDSHLLNVAWTASPNLKLVGFVYALDFASSPLNSGLTTGVRANGKSKAGAVAFAWTLSAARQTDWRNGPRSFDLGYLEADLAGTFDIWTVKAGFERLDGDGTTGFATPLGTNHGFNGWSDVFVIAGGTKTWADGIEDASLGLTAAPRLKTRLFANPVITLVWHDFNAERTGADLAAEWDVQAQVALTPKLTALVKYADFARETRVPTGTALAPADRRKAWVSLEYRL